MILAFLYLTFAVLSAGVVVKSSIHWNIYGIVLGLVGTFIGSGVAIYCAVFSDGLWL